VAGRAFTQHGQQLVAPLIHLQAQALGHHALFALAQLPFTLMRPMPTHQGVVAADAHGAVRGHKVKPERIEGLLAWPSVGSEMASDEVRTTAIPAGAGIHRGRRLAVAGRELSADGSGRAPIPACIADVPAESTSNCKEGGEPTFAGVWLRTVWRRCGRDALIEEPNCAGMTDNDAASNADAASVGLRCARPLNGDQSLLSGTPALRNACAISARCGASLCGKLRSKTRIE